MKRMFILLMLAGMLYADAAIANPKTSKTTHKRMKRKTVKAHYAYRKPVLRMSPTTNDILNSTDNSGIGKNSSDNFSGVMNNGSMSSNGTYQNAGFLNKK